MFTKEYECPKSLESVKLSLTALPSDGLEIATRQGVASIIKKECNDSNGECPLDCPIKNFVNAQPSIIAGYAGFTGSSSE